ncbi:uncharacterized protein PHACADRAFT_102061 [Phanerochaete carnosa HHB-10118-sp]|uniref:Ubiquitin-like domain-containing protein n=1 Tax=Phanerochaete carnosa (strain HHB-10118-sp) TaxID=650164 RepID=K5VYZ1_PHACS|nr:uncharacterized protein PHACADRAFT_102061 [Phanerochaete carnosa HHB-10118-sp]EKM52060.1 hypothetical protein PHACADRAFT_102061 [Phanerochaete carnosa HHB-10118-sp]
MALSEKAKGKQRAGPIQEDDAGEGSAKTKPLVIRFTEGIEDLSLLVEQDDAVRDMKRKIRDARPSLTDRRLRLIHLGRLLTDGTNLYSWLESLEERQRKALESSEGQDQTASPSIPTTWLHCSVGPKLEPGEEEETKVQVTQLKPLRGFDRLAAAGFSQEDIANIRSQFHANSAGDYLDHEFSTEEEFDEHVRALEEQWIDSIDNHGAESLSQSSLRATLLNGVVIGFFFPILPYFFFYERKPAVFWEDGSEHEVIERPIFSRRMQMGITIGMLMNVVFGMWTYVLTSA